MTRETVPSTRVLEQVPACIPVPNVEGTCGFPGRKQRTKGEIVMIIVRMKQIRRFLSCAAVSAAMLSLCTVPSMAMKTEFSPTLSISETYTDNYKAAGKNKEAEYTTEYALGLELGVIGKKAACYLRYEPAYVDYRYDDANDSMQHNLALEGTAAISKQVILHVSETFSRGLNRNLKTGQWIERDTNTSSVGFSWDFGPTDSLAVDYTYAFDSHDIQDADEFQSHKPSISLVYWFSPKLGVESALSYVNLSFDSDADTVESYRGDFQIVTALSKNFHAYLGYSQMNTYQEANDSTSCVPSVGIRWMASKTSQIDLGVGYLMQEWEGNEDTDSVIFQADAFNEWPLSPRSSFSITGTSGYSEASSDAASLGVNVNYNLGALYSYDLTRRLSFSLMGAYTRNEFKDPDVDRTDEALMGGTGFVWAPCQWLDVTLEWIYVDFTTDSADREDYQENRGLLKVTYIPYKPVSLSMGDKRDDVEKRIFNDW